MRGKRARVNADSGEVDDNHWAQVAANREDDDGQHSDQGEAQFDTGFDDFGDDAFDEGVTAGIGSLGLGGNDDAGEQDLLAATQGIERKVKPEFVNYAKRAKRVDVRKLKENIWKGLDIVVVEDSEDEDMVCIGCLRLSSSLTFACRTWTATMPARKADARSRTSPQQTPLKRDNSVRSLLAFNARTPRRSSTRLAQASASSVCCIWQMSRV